VGSPSAELRERWLEAVLLPGFEDPRKSCLAELSEYGGEPLEAVERRCLGAVAEQREVWNERARDSERALTEFYDRCDAYLYDLLWWHALQRGTAPAWNARLLDIAARHGCKRYLDFGGGVGTNAILLRRAGLEVTVADISDVLQRFARWRLSRRGLDARFLDLKREPLPDAAYDLVSAVDVLEHVADPVGTLRTLHRALAPGGILVFDLIASDADPDEPFHLLRSKYPIRAAVRALGFERLERFQKYLVYRKVERSPLAQRALRGWDVLRWRLYYAAQGKWPRG
jgi:SAM-dependent methyltransferase